MFGKKETPPPSEIERIRSKSDALRLIMRRGEGLVKLLGSPFELNQEPDKQAFERFNNAWDFLLKQILNPQEERLQRRYFPDPINGFAWDPLLQQQVDPDTLKDDKNLDYTCMTSTTLIPRDGKVSLFGGGGVGLLFDIRNCDLKGERFIFTQDACSDNDWWHNPGAKNYHQNYPSQTINNLRVNAKLEEAVDRPREYNEVQAGVNTKSLSAIVLQPQELLRNVNAKEQYYREHFNAIYRKLYLASMLNRHLPIIILDANEGPSEYTFEQQQEDLRVYLEENPTNALCKWLHDQNASLMKVIPVEVEERLSPRLNNKDIKAIKQIEALLLEKISLAGDKAKILHEIITVQRRITDAESDDDITFVHKRLVHLNGLYNKIEVKMTDIDTSLATHNYQPANHPHLVGFLQVQLDLINQLANTEDKEKAYLFSINHERLAKSLESSKNTYLRHGLVYTNNNKRHHGIAQLFADFTVQNYKVMGKSAAEGKLTEDEFNQFLAQQLTPDQLNKVREHYSREHAGFIMGPLRSFRLGNNLTITQPNPHDIKSEIYQENGKVYLKWLVNKYPIVNRENGDLVDYLHGPLEAVFKLTDAGFQFESLQTNSKFMHEVYMGIEVTQAVVDSYIDAKAAESKATVDRYKAACATYLGHLLEQDLSKEEVKEKVEVLQELQGILHQGDCGLFQMVEDPLSSLDFNKRKQLLGKHTAGYVFTENELYYIDKNMHCVKLNTTPAQMTELKRLFGMQPLQGDYPTVAVGGVTLSDKHLSLIHTHTNHSHELYSPTDKVNEFHQKLIHKKSVLTKLSDNAFTTFVKALGVVAVSILTVGTYTEAIYNRFFGASASEGNRFVGAVNSPSPKSS